MKTIEYGPHPEQFAELTLPDGHAKGVVVFFHGGFWRARYDLSLGRPIAESLVRNGWATLNMEYRRTDLGGGYPETFDDVAAGFDLLADQHVDTDIVVSMGHSAGGHLAAWGAGRPRHPNPRWSTPRVAATHAVTLGAVLNLADAVESDLGRGAARLFLGDDTDHRYREADPSQQIPFGVPVWCVHGIDDDVVPPSQSEDFVAATIAAGGRAEYVQVDGDHDVVVDVDSPAWASVLHILDEITQGG